MAKRGGQKAGLKAIEWKEHLHAPDAQLVDDLYGPALERGVHYDRCCAYFSSTVLSAAARGFGGLIKTILDNESSVPKPAVRLLVNEELHPDDLEAMLSTDDYTPLIKKLLKQFKTPKDALERDRLKMLAWLTASGWLQVRVGIMRNTGGILHAKYGIVSDAQGDSIAFMGSDNETGEGLFGNYEELRVFTSWKERKDTDYYTDRFEKLWLDQDENVLTIPLPQAVEEKLIKLAPAKPPAIEPIADKDTLAAAMTWRFVAAAPFLPNGEYACDATAMVDMWPHQKNVVDNTAIAYPAGRLLCDEVGMGKTIEAILVLRRLLCGRGVKRALLLVPAGLLKQWQDEIREKGGLLVPYWDNRVLYYPDGSRKNVEESEVFAKHDVLLVSREWARLENNRQHLLTCPKWDLTLLDEAHAARRRSSREGEFNTGNLLLDLLRELQLRRRTRGILLLSATPMQTQPWEPWDLLSVLGVGGKWLVEFNDIRTFYHVTAELQKSAPAMADARMVESLVSSDSEFPPPRNGRVDGLSNSLVFAFGGERTAYSNWLRQGAPLGRRMHRNTRDTLRQYHEQGLIDYKPPVRDVRDVVFDYAVDGERKLYNAVKHYIDDRFERLENEKGGKGFVMTIYRRRAASSPYALRSSLERRLDGCEKVISKQWFGTWIAEDEIDPRDLSDADIETVDPALPATAEEAEAEKRQIKALLDDLDALGFTDSKFDKFREVLDEITADGRSVLVFTEYYDTLTYLRGLLSPAYGNTIACYSGRGGEVWDGEKWVGVSKAEITERLRQRKLRVLVCTDAASEGLNLQAASALVDYDLPWNPSKVEQRIGRIDRIGQIQSELPIRNMFLNNSVDMRVYQVLRERCGLFEHFVGRMQPVLALARDALRNERLDGLLDEIARGADSVESDQTIANTFIESLAEKPSKVEPPLTRQDLEAAVAMLEGTQLPVKARKVKGQKSWRVTGATPKAVEVSADREALERTSTVIPLSLGSEVVNQIGAKIPAIANRLPLVVAEYSDAAYKAVEARWVESSSMKTVRSAAELRKLIDEWDGSSPLPAAVLKAQDDARKAAKGRVQALIAEDKTQEQTGVDSQLAAARTRLMRELGRTLRCMGTGDLGSIFQAQITRENRADGRYRKAHTLLGGVPAWSSDDLASIEAYVNARTPIQKKARIAGSEIDAALNDPRWRILSIQNH